MFITTSMVERLTPKSSPQVFLVTLDPNDEERLARSTLRGAFAPRPNPKKESVTMSIRKMGVSALTFAATFLVPLAAFAAEEKAGANQFDVKAYAMIAAGLAIGLGVIGGGLAQGKAASAALEGISRNPGAASRIQTPMILSLALIESLVLLSFVIAFFLQGK